MYVKSWMVVDGDGPLGVIAITATELSGYAYGVQEIFSETKMT